MITLMLKRKTDIIKNDNVCSKQLMNVIHPLVMVQKFIETNDKITQEVCGWPAYDNPSGAVQTAARLEDSSL